MSNHDTIIIGSGICGMFTALALASQGRPVTVLERDPPPPQGSADAAFFEWQRLGAAQFRHPHAFLGVMCSLIQQRYPDLLQELYAAGARPIELPDMMPPELRGQYTPQPGDELLFVLLCRRATMETVIRRYIERLQYVDLRTLCQVGNLVLDASGRIPRAVGVEVRDRSGAEPVRETLHASTIIDASGRSTRFPALLDKHGIKVEEEAEGAQIVYYTRHYQLRPGEQEPPRGDNRSAGDLGYLKYGVFPGDNGHFAIILCCLEQETTLIDALRDPERFDAICRSIPGTEPWLAHAEPTTESFGIGDIRSVWRSYVVDDQPLIHNFFAVGDAALRTNPLYGRGCSTSIMHAHLLADVLESTADADAQARHFHQRTRDELRPIYEASRNEDRNNLKRGLAIMEGRELERPDSLKSWFGAAFGDALTAAARERLHVMRGMLKTFHLLEKPGDFLRDRRIRWTIYRYMLRGRKRNATARLQQGPDRAALLGKVAPEAHSADAA